MCKTGPPKLLPSKQWIEGTDERKEGRHGPGELCWLWGGPAGSNSLHGKSFTVCESRGLRQLCTVPGSEASCLWEAMMVDLALWLALSALHCSSLLLTSTWHLHCSSALWGHILHCCKSVPAPELKELSQFPPAEHHASVVFTTLPPINLNLSTDSTPSWMRRAAIHLC